MGEARFSKEYLNKLNDVKSQEYRDSLFEKLDILNTYLREDEFEDIYSAIEEAVPIVKEGNIVKQNSFGTFSMELIDKPADFIQMMIEELVDWFMWNSDLLKCKLFILAYHIDEYTFTDDDEELLLAAIMSNFIEQGLMCPDVVLVPTDGKNQALQNGFYILGLK